MTGRVGFGVTSAWLAIRSEQPDEVAQALCLHDVRPAPWSVVPQVQHHPPEPPSPVFLTPPIDGWTLVLLHGCGACVVGHQRSVGWVVGKCERANKAQYQGETCGSSFHLHNSCHPLFDTFLK